MHSHRQWTGLPVAPHLHIWHFNLSFGHEFININQASRRFRCVWWGARNHRVSSGVCWVILGQVLSQSCCAGMSTRELHSWCPLGPHKCDSFLSIHTLCPQPNAPGLRPFSGWSITSVSQSLGKVGRSLREGVVSTKVVSFTPKWSVVLRVLWLPWQLACTATH